MRNTQTEENYLKAILKHSETEESVLTNVIAQELGTTPASVTDMVKKLHEKKLVEHTPYYGVKLTSEGKKVALYTVRRHRLWETFLVEKLNYTWDEIHETAEQLEHIESEKLTAKLDEFLGYPRFDPHGDPIPDENLNMLPRNTVLLCDLHPNTPAVVAGVTQHNPDFLQYLDRLNLHIGTQVTVIEVISFDDSRLISIHNREMMVSSSVTKHLLVSQK